MSQSKLHRRDQIAMRLCNWVLEHVATAWYRDMIAGSIRYGLRSAARNSRPYAYIIEIDRSDGNIDVSVRNHDGFPVSGASDSTGTLTEHQLIRRCFPSV